MARTPWELMFETGTVRVYECLLKRHARWHYRDIFSSFLIMKVCCMLSLESPHRSDSNENTQYTIINIKKHRKFYPKYDNVCSYGIFPRDSRTSSKQPWSH